ncbi:DUF881 domain-containing protein [Alicyclobacillus fastidiosus]|uniref:DUF881 domain-containing protein n=1 Tax=Alicyclobacillus fastidiosus TaxID=392011 RepID=A0ABY6ZD36_9BACL|nr:DUF881 domain-containing protein [Alicyclobacillus fastidiosus]WAH40432.1 DUF881 domain-containing protein [Alicyclobacillus fastidiosus]GMA61831.1 hypothetical protein GCM10025859_22710 [Alicyclobacillus fastidiosus]
MQRKSLILGVSAISAALGFMLTVQITSRPSYSGNSTSYIDLRTQVDELAQEHQILENDISKDNAQLDEYQAAKESGSSLQQVLLNDQKTVEEQAGITPVSGPGIVITIEYDPTVPAVPQDMALYPSMQDQMLAETVNTLFGNGATAISINGQRLVTTSSIRLVSGLAGIEGVNVNKVPITMPYQIMAVGDVQTMQAALTVASLQDYYNMMGVGFKVTAHAQKDGVQVVGYSGVLPGTWAKEGNG